MERKVPDPESLFMLGTISGIYNITEYKTAQQHDAERQTVAKAVCAAGSIF